MGKRTKELAHQLVSDIKEKTDDHIPLFTSDEYQGYENAILENYGVEEKVERTGKPGRPRKPRKVPSPDLKYVQVEKHREKGKVVKVETKIIFGNEEDIRKVLKDSPVSEHINTAFVERQNLTFRESNGRLSRKTLSYSKELELLTLQLWLFLGYYHFVRVHLGLRLSIQSGRKKWMNRTPMMATGKTDHIWTWNELVLYHILPKSTGGDRN